MLSAIAERIRIISHALPWAMYQMWVGWKTAAEVINELCGSCSLNERQMTSLISLFHLEIRKRKKYTMKLLFKKNKIKEFVNLSKLESHGPLNAEINFFLIGFV